LRAGEIDVGFEILGPFLSQVSGKTLRALAVSSDKRFPTLSDVPTVQESGVRSYRGQVTTLPTTKTRLSTTASATGPAGRSRPHVLKAPLRKQVNARMAKRQRMRWSPSGAHCVATARAAVLDGRMHDLMTTQLAA
jgi:hypothetical protein